ncbi:MAG: phosphatidate cytidylyltransferase, partial [Chthoniobacterales bacterium]|nr:phosphatidate cytidylyltransferase [Chthoniobacterales bacterium]
MSPSAALHDPVFRAYLGLVLAVLAGAGVVLALLHLVFRIELGSVWKTYWAWLWLAPLSALFLFAGRVPFILGVTAVGLLGARDFLRVSELAADRLMSAVVYGGIVLAGLAALSGRGAMSFPALAIALLLLVPIRRNRVEGEIRKVSLGVIAVVLLGWMWGHLGLLANSRHAYGYLCYLLFATEVTDVAAFTFGKMFGRHPLRSEISPRKTWEGALGALLVAMILPWLLRFSFPFFGPAQLILTGLIVGIGGPLGDLALSVLKRDLGVKDWSAAIPGHGGV